MEHISASAMVAFSTNPVLFKIRYVNREQIGSTTGISAVIGKAFHHAMEVYYSTDAEGNALAEGEAIRMALEAGTRYVEEYPEGWIEWSKIVDCRAKAIERVAFAITEYAKATPYGMEDTVAIEDEINERIDVDWHGKRLRLPVPLKGYVDRLTRRKDGKLVVRDYKTASRFSDLEAIDGAKIIQAVTYYFLVAAKYGEAPYSMVYEEVKTTGSKDGEQVRRYEIVYDDNRLYFDFYLRFMEDMLRGLNGEMVYVPNVKAMFDNEVAIVAYLQRLDVSEEAAKAKEKAGVTTLMEALNADIERTSDVRRLLGSLDGRTAEFKSMDYAKMSNEERITSKLLEHGMIMRFDSVIRGATVDLYRFAPGMGVKMAKLRNYADDVQMVLGATGVRVLAPIPGTSLVGFEVPASERRFPDMPEAKGCELAIGETVDGQVRRFDLREAPHMLVAGSTGSGKSVFLHSVIRQLMQTDAELILIDPKQVEFSEYGCAITGYADIADALRSMVNVMESRYGILKADGKRNAIDAGMNPLVGVIDEFADIMSMQGEEGTVSDCIRRIAQKGRAAGVHLVIATQRASTKIIDGDIKVNFPVKAVFRMAKAVDSVVMLDEAGAEKLLGKGDMLFQTGSGIERLQAFRT